MLCKTTLKIFCAHGAELEICGFEIYKFLDEFPGFFQLIKNFDLFWKYANMLSDLLSCLG